MEIPSNLVLKIVGGRRYIPLLVVSFGLISVCTAFVHKFSGLMACRFFLGLTEGGMIPGIAFFLSGFYRRHELAFRVAIYVSGASLAGAFGGLLAAGLSQIPTWGAHSAPIHTWRNIFFFEGLISCLLGIASFWLLPDSPATCKFLSAKDRIIAARRIEMDNSESRHEKPSVKHVYRAVFNINNTLCGIGLGLVNLSVQAVSLFTPTILKALGWTAIKAQLYSVPPFVVAAVWAILNCWVSDRIRKRGVVAAVNSAIALIGFAILATAHEAKVKYVALFIACAGAVPPGPAYITWGINNASGPTVRAVSAAYIVMWGQVGAFIATWSYLPKDAPGFRAGHWINFGSQSLSVVVSLLGIAYVRWENRVRDKGGRNDRLSNLSENGALKLGYRHPNVRYVE